MTLVELRNREELGAFFRRRAAVHAYELGDLDDFFWPHTRWFGWMREQRLEEVMLLYGEPEPPVLIALADDAGAMEKLLRAVSPNLPSSVYAHLSPGLLHALAPRLVPAHEPVAHQKLTLVDRDALDAHDHGGVEPLTSKATAACAALCRILLEDGIDVISLNVRADNAAAIRSYGKLGFTHAADYVEVLLGPASGARSDVPSGVR